MSCLPFSSDYNGLKMEVTNKAWRYLELLLSSFFSICLVSVHLVHPYSSIDKIAARKKWRFTISVRSDFHITDCQSIAEHAFACRVLMSFSVDEMLLLR